MSHHIYTTPGFIVHSTPQGEAGKYFLIFTRDLGMIGATAQGVRLSQSKLRYYTQDFSYSLFSVVKGKEVWRVTGAKEMEKGMEIRQENRKLYVRILSLLKRLLPGEEKNERLFLILEKFYYYLENKLEKEDGELVEYITVLRILNCLGYMKSNPALNDFCADHEIGDKVLNKLKIQKEFVVKEINEGLKESQL